MIHRETRINYENYQEKRRQANRTCRRKKKIIQKQLEKIKKCNKQNERRKFYKAVDQQNRRFHPRVTGCESKGGRILGQKKF
jgi:hypothetical protein